MKYLTLKKFKKVNKDFWERDLRTQATIFYGQVNTEKKFTAVEDIGKTITQYMDEIRKYNFEPKAGKKLARMLSEGKIVIRTGQKGYKIKVGIKNIFKRYSKMIEKIKNNEITSEKQILSFFNRLYDYADYVGIFLN